MGTSTGGEARGRTRGDALVTTIVPRRDRRAVATCADVASGAGVAGLATLGLMFAFEVPKGGPFVFGTTNDVLGVAHSVLLMPVLAELSAELPPGPARDVMLPVTLAACAAGAASGALLVARVLPFAPSTVVSVLAMEIQATWMLVTNDRLLRRADVPRPMARLGRLSGAGMLAGAGVAALGLLFPRDSAARRAAFVAGGIPGVAAWLAWPAWLHLAARYLRTSDASGRARTA